MSGQEVFITGGAGFIGVNAADHFLRRGDAVTVYDNLSRRGGRANLEWLFATHGGERLHVVEADIRDYPRLAAAVVEASSELSLSQKRSRERRMYQFVRTSRKLRMVSQAAAMS